MYHICFTHVVICEEYANHIQVTKLHVVYLVELELQLQHMWHAPHLYKHIKIHIINPDTKMAGEERNKVL